MFKRILLATAFVGAFTLAGFGTPSSAQAECYGRGYGGGFGGGFGAAYGGGFGPSYGRGFSRSASFYRGAPYRGSSFYRGGGFGYDYGRYSSFGKRGRGVSLSIGF